MSYETKQLLSTLNQIETSAESAEVDTEVSISLLTAEGLKQIHDAYKAKRRPNFQHGYLKKADYLWLSLLRKVYRRRGGCAYLLKSATTHFDKNYTITTY